MWKRTLGGVSGTVVNLARAYRDMGHEVVVITSDVGDGAIELPRRGPAQLPATLRALKREQPDIVHIHSRLTFVLPALVYRAGNRRARIGFTFHTQPAPPPCLPISEPQRPAYSGMGGWIAQALLNRCDLVTSVADNVFDNLEKHEGIVVGRRRVIPSGVEDTGRRTDKDAAQRAFDVHGRFPVLSSTGVFAWDWKVAGHQCCIEAMPAIQKAYPNAVLLIAGDGNEKFRNYLADIVEKLGLESDVRLLGNIGNVSDMLEATDIYLHIALYEACSIAIIEAMARGKPIVGARSGGIPELITDGVTGLLADPKPADVSEAVLRLLSNPALSEEIGRAAKMKAETDHNWARIASRYIAAFEESR